MEWLTENILWIVLGTLFIWMHLKMHGGHHGHGGRGGHAQEGHGGHGGHGCCGGGPAPHRADDRSESGERRRASP